LLDDLRHERKWVVASSNGHHGKNDRHEHEDHSSRRERTRHSPAAEGTGHQTFQLVFTLSAPSGAVVKIEKIDATGKRREVAMNETLTLVGEGNSHAIEAVLDEAFEAGISSVVEAGHADDDDMESEEDTELRRVLLTGMVGAEIRHRLQRRLVQRLALSRTLRH
jgi:hypothetical protein